MNDKPYYLIGIVLWAILTASLVLLAGGQGVLMAILTIPLVLVLPGYTLSAALFPNCPIGFPERLLMSLGISIALAIMGGFVLHLLSLGISAASWVLLLSGVTLAASLVAFWRGHRQPSASFSRSSGMNIVQIGMLALALCVVGAALAVAYDGATHQPQPGFTQFWILPADATNQATLQLGMHNLETTDLSYHLQVKVGSSTIQTWSPIELQRGERWETTLSLPPATGTAMVEALLYRLDQPDGVYRRVVWQQREQHDISYSDGK